MASFDYRKKDIIWTASDYDVGQANKEFPYIELVEWEPTFSGTLEAITYWLQRAFGEPGEVYKGLYVGKPTKNTYVLPFFMDTHHQIGQNWEENQAPLGQWVKDQGSKAMGGVRTIYPAVGILYPKTYKGMSEYRYDVSFHLINTTGGSEEEAIQNIKKNRAFLEQFIKMNLHVQHTPLTVTPPCIYEALIPGVRWSPACVVANLSVSNKGTLNRMPGIGGGTYIVPDAWEVQIQFRELLNESRSIYSEAIRDGVGNVGGMNVRVVQDEKEVGGKRVAQLRKLGETVGGVFK